MTSWQKISFVFLFVAGSTRSVGQDFPDPQFTHITPADGLSTQYIRKIFQDSRGLMWICTTNGLNRYDGNMFKVYRHEPGNLNSLPDDDIWCIAEDKKGNFWVGTQNGLSYFQPGENRFTNYFYQPGIKNSLASRRAENIVIDDSGYIWVGSLNGLQRFDPSTKSFQLIEFASKEELLRNVNAQAIYHLYISSKKQLWVCAGGNLFLLDTKQLVSRKIVSKVGADYGVNSIFEDSKGQYWLCFWGLGFARFDGEHLPGKQDYADTSAIYFRMAEWKDLHNDTWLVITRDDALCFFNKTSGKLFFLKHDNDKPGSFSSHSGTEIIKDRNNNLWIATQNGIEVLEPSKQVFQYHWLGEKKDREDYYNYGTPQPVFRDGPYYWAALWHGKGLVKLDSNWKALKHYASIPAGSAYPGNKTVFDIYKDNKKIFWFTTDRSIVSFDEAKNNFHEYTPSDIQPDAFEFRRILSIGHSNFLISTRHLGLYIFNKEEGRFVKHITAEIKNGLPANDVREMTYDKNGVVWIATSAGICSLDTVTFTIAGPLSNPVLSLPGNCLSVAVDNNNMIWAGSDNGLYKFSADKTKVTKYTTVNGLCSNSVSRILCDKNGDIWMNTSNCVCLYMQKENRFQRFYKGDGLPQNALNGEINIDTDGTLYFGDPGIVLTVHPAELSFNKTKPDILVTDAAVGNKHCIIQTNSAGEKYLQTKYGAGALVINFAVLNYNSPNLNRYYYKLDGVDNDWRQGDKGVASYANIAPGDYILRVKGSNNVGVMNEEGDMIRVMVAPLWYQTLLFKIVCIVLLAAIVFYFVRRRIKAVRKEALFQQRIAETEMQALRAQMNPHFIFNSLNSIENFIMKNEKRLASDYLNKFSNLVRSILDSSRNEMVPLAKDMDTLKLYVELEQLRFNNKFTYHANVEAGLLNGDYRVPSLLIQPYIENAIVHGVAHSTKTDLQITITAVLENDKIKYTIIDNGIGRKKAGEYNMQNKPGHKSVGLGITAERIAHFNKQKNANGSVRITDMFENGEPSGTKVEIILNSN